MTISRRTLWLAACAALLAAAFTFGLGGYPLLEPDEGRNAEIAREMAATNDYVLPRLNGIPYADKPALYFAAGALAMEVLGPTVTAARLPSLLFTLATLALVAWFAARVLDRDAAWTASIATAATPFTLAYARTVIFDSAVTFFIVAALVALYGAIEERGSQSAISRQDTSGAGAGSPTAERQERGRAGDAAAWWRAAAWAAMGLGVLTKGPVALAVPLMIALPYAAWRRAWRRLADPVALLLFAAIVLPWLYVMSSEIPGYLSYVLLTETTTRLTRGLGREGPLWYFIVIFPVAALPWSVVALVRWGRARGRGPLISTRTGGRDPLLVFLALWIAVPLLFFTLSQSKRPQYVLPLVPAMGLLVAAAWRGGEGRLPGVRAAAAALAALGAGLVVGAQAIPRLVPATPDVAAAIPGTSVALGLVCAAAGALAWLVARRPAAAALFALSLPVAAIPFVSRDLMREIGRDRSAVEIAAAVTEVSTTDTEVIGVRAYPPSLSFYLRHTIIVSSDDGAELTSNYVLRNFDRLVGRVGPTLRPGDWWRAALLPCERPRVFLARSDDRDARNVLAARLALLVETRKYAAYGPCVIEDLASARP